MNGQWLLDRAKAGDTEAHAVVEILLSDVFATDGRVWVHVDERHSSINFDALVNNGTFSGGERALLGVAWALWNGGTGVDLCYLFDYLGDGFLRVAVNAIVARRGGRPLPAAGGWVLAPEVTR